MKIRHPDDIRKSIDSTLSKIGRIPSLYAQVVTQAQENKRPHSHRRRFLIILQILFTVILLLLTVTLAMKWLL